MGKVEDKFCCAAGSLILGSNRFYCYSDNRWVSNAVSTYGSNLPNAYFGCGTGVDPSISWQTIGHLIPKGKKIKKLGICSRSSSPEVTDFEISLSLMSPNSSNSWSGGIDSNSEVIVPEILRTNFWDPAWGGNLMDQHAAEYNINSETTDLSKLTICMKPVGTITATRYLYTTYYIEIE